jgi:hypothetical protein
MNTEITGACLDDAKANSKTFKQKGEIREANKSGNEDGTGECHSNSQHESWSLGRQGGETYDADPPRQLLI